MFDLIKFSFMSYFPCLSIGAYMLYIGFLDLKRKKIIAEEKNNIQRELTPEDICPFSNEHMKRIMECNQQTVSSELYRLKAGLNSLQTPEQQLKMLGQKLEMLEQQSNINQTIQEVNMINQNIFKDFKFSSVISYAWKYKI